MQGGGSDYFFEMISGGDKWKDVKRSKSDLRAKATYCFHLIVTKILAASIERVSIIIYSVIQ